jgi:hypothetical protein
MLRSQGLTTTTPSGKQSWNDRASRHATPHEPHALTHLCKKMTNGGYDDWIGYRQQQQNNMYLRCPS